MKMFSAKKLTAFLLSAIMLIGMLPAAIFAADGAVETPTYVLAGSDYQADSGDSAGTANINAIIDKLKTDGYTAMDGFLFAGDYSVGSTTSSNVNALSNTIQNAGLGLERDDMVLIQGNHDNSNEYSGTEAGLVGSVLNNSGENDTEKYGVFVINEQDYMWRNSSKSTIETTASNLKAYLDAKDEEDYTKPIFVISHLPLNYNMRTKNDGDGKYANLLFDVLNEAGDNDLNIIFLFGHDHSNGWDDYLGGSAIYLAKGDKINIAQGSQTNFKEETLNFTYMNAGYVGYYRNVNSGAETDLTMTVFEITNSQVIVKRYSADGLHDLKSIGVSNSYKNETAYDPNTTVYASPQYIKLTDNKTVESNGVSVSAPNITGVTATVDKTNPDSGLYSAYVKFDITPADYTQGDVAEVALTLPTDAGFDTSRPVTVWDRAQNLTVSKPIVDGKVYFTTQHFSEYDVFQLTKSTSEVTDWKEIPGETETIFRLTDSLESGKKYLIVSSNAAGRANAVNLNGNSINSTSVTIIADSKGNYIEAPAASAQWTYTSNRFRNVNSTNRYLRGNNTNLSSTTSTGYNTTYITWSYSNGLRVQSSSYYQSYRYLHSDFTTSETSSTTNRVYIFVEEELVTSSTYAGMAGQTDFTIATGAYADRAAVVNMVKSKIQVYLATQSDYSDAAEIDDYTISGTVNPGTVGDYTLTVTYGGETLGTIKVKVSDKQVVDADLLSNIGTVVKGSAATTATGAQILVTYEGGSTATVNVTLNMITAGDYDTKTIGTYEGLTVTYGDYEFADFTLEVVGQNDKPAYPNDGAVRVNKTASGIDFQASGVAKVELSTAGVNANKGVDLIVMIDTSSSMDDYVDGVMRITVVKEAMQNLINQLKTAETVEGEPLDIRIAVADFCRYYSGSNTPYDVSSSDRLSSGNITTSSSTAKAPEVFSGTKSLTAGAFVDVHGLSVNAFDANLTSVKSGTNYDYGVDAVYQLGSAIKAKNEDDGVERDLVVMFMSDGAPFQYNYFGANSSNSNWNNWLQGTVTDTMFANGSQKHYYNPDNNKHWMAEAIKGDPDQRYDVIRKSDDGLEDVIGEATGVLAGKANAWSVPGLGATMYTIGFCLATDQQISTTSMTNVLTKMASVDARGNPLYYPASTADELNNVFSSIGNAVVYAATNARFVDQLGANFDLVLTPRTYNVIENGNTVPKTYVPTIEVKRYTLYTKDNIGDTTADGKTVTAAMIGQRTGEVELLEAIVFSEDGKKAYSTHVDGDGDGQYGAIKSGDSYIINTAASAADNILIDNVICARTFWYNTTGNGIAMEGVSIPQKDGTLSNVLPAETFYWKVGTVNETELAISYPVYLSGSQEGNKPAGSYATNNYAILYYTNWLGNDIQQDTTSPTIAWKSASVSYAFYLVNSKGEIIVDPSTGKTGPFAERAKVTQPVFHSEILLNNTYQERSLDVTDVAASILPEGYKIYDDQAEYHVIIYSNGTGKWTIEKTDGKVDSTYVTGFAGADEFSNVLDENTVGYDYTHTTVWFAVVWIPSTIPDSVVIDFGLPVDINVLLNDQFGDSATLVGVAPAGSMPTTGNNNQGVIYTETLDADFTKNPAEGAFGTLTMSGSTVRYTPDTTKAMTMDCAESFEYAVRFSLPDGNINGFYYGKITVIPASTIYFEESFVTFENSTATSADFGVWNQVYDEKYDENADITQSEDRPGKYSLADFDANNFYGYDPAYANFTKYSLGGAKKVTVDMTTGHAQKAPKAIFTFTGTGFDIISLTDSDSGYIVAYVYDADGNFVTWSAVDMYYGYSYDEENDTWAVDAGATDCIWQVPVLKIEGLDYATYQVEILVGYMETLDHQADGSYSFWLDAIRIYDSAELDTKIDEDTTIGEVYGDDNEYAPQHMTLRDLLLAPADDNADITAKEQTGIVFIDGKDKATLAEYANPGPNNETYLSYQQSVAFRLKTNNKPASVQIGIKLAYGETAAQVKLGTGDFVKVVTATDMYYDLGSSLNWTPYDADGNEIPVNSMTDDTVVAYYMTAPIVLLNDTDGTVVSITNVKFTFPFPKPTPAMDEELSNVSFEDGAMVLSIGLADANGTNLASAEETAPAVTAVVDAETVEYALAVMNALYAPVVEPDPFVPEKLELNWSESTIKENKKATLTISTSTDVVSLTLNGEEMDYIDLPIISLKGWRISITYERVWFFTAKGLAVGTHNFAVVAYDEEGLASEPVETELTVTAKNNRKSNRR